MLIADDSAVSQQLLRQMIEADPELRVVGWAKNGQEAVQAVAWAKPDVITMDITMPVMDGATSLREILAFDKDALVIVSTADVQIKSITNVLEIGAFLVLKKPPTKEGVCDALTMAAEQRR